MRTTGLFVTCVIAWVMALGATMMSNGPVVSGAAGEIAHCLIPMQDALPPVVPCSDQVPTWSGPGEPPDPQWMAQPAR